jgi:hypothetical protein
VLLLPLDPTQIVLHKATESCLAELDLRLHQRSTDCLHTPGTIRLRSEPCMTVQALGHPYWAGQRTQPTPRESPCVWFQAYALYIFVEGSRALGAL